MQLRSGAALLFDIDGTLVESDPLHLKAFNAIFGPLGHHFDHDRFALELQGKSNRVIGARFLPDETPERQHDIMMQKEAAFRDLAGEGLEPVAGLAALLDWADANAVPMVAVTNAPRPNADLLLAGAGVTDRFRGLVIGEELPQGKPHPMPYLEGLKIAQGEAAASLAFEDSLPGIASAVGAGIVTVGIMTGLDETALLEGGATLAVRDFTDPRLMALVETTLFA
ncbi:MAG TPA: HAD-IA family hydrolase [Devosia sp.]|jgi:phosphoglycolate phosphatase|nr:HAD-IA family hydrolase [Devosia sp.]